MFSNLSQLADADQTIIEFDGQQKIMVGWLDMSTDMIECTVRIYDPNICAGISPHRFCRTHIPQKTSFLYLGTVNLNSSTAILYAAVLLTDAIRSEFFAVVFQHLCSLVFHVWRQYQYRCFVSTNQLQKSQWFTISTPTCKRSSTETQAKDLFESEPEHNCGDKEDCGLWFEMRKMCGISYKSN